MKSHKAPFSQVIKQKTNPKINRFKNSIRLQKEFVVALQGF